MANFIISLGILNKKLLLPLIYLVLYTFINFFYFYNEYNEVTMYLEHFGFSVGQMMTYFIIYAFKYHRVSVKKKKKSLISSIKDYFFLLVINCFYMVDYIFPYYINGENAPEEEKPDESEMDKVEELFITDGIEIILLTLVTFLMLKYKYYIHHIISALIFLVLCASMDLLVNNFSNIDTLTFINSIVYIIVDTVEYTYFKYLINDRYHFFMDVLFFQGVTSSIVHILSIAIILIAHSKNGSNKLLLEFFNFYNEYGGGYMVLWFMMGLIFIGFFVGYLEFAILNELTPNYIFICYCLAKIPTLIMSINGYKRWIVLLLSIIQIFISLFYLEILEYNFCSLNANTKKNIEERERRQINEDIDDKDNEIAFKGYDVSELMDIKEMDDIDGELE